MPREFLGLAVCPQGWPQLESHVFTHMHHLWHRLESPWIFQINFLDKLHIFSFGNKSAWLISNICWKCQKLWHLKSSQHLHQHTTWLDMLNFFHSIIVFMLSRILEIKFRHPFKYDIIWKNDDNICLQTYDLIVLI